MNISADLSEVLKLAQDLTGAAVQSDANIAKAIHEVAPKIEAEIKATIPVTSLDHAHLIESVAINHKGPAEARIGYVGGDPGWRGHFLENGTAHSAPNPVVRTAGAKFEAEFARAILAGPVFKK